jgi:hypothetical protein
VSRPAKTFTAKQGQYLAFIHLYTRLHRRPPAETDMQEYFRVSPPSVHQMVLTLERGGFIRRQPKTPASKCSLIRNTCPTYFDPGFNPSKSLRQGTSGQNERWQTCQRIDTGLPIIDMTGNDADKWPSRRPNQHPSGKASDSRGTKKPRTMPGLSRWSLEKISTSTGHPS